MISQLYSVAERFASNHSLIDIRPLGNGLINDTFLVKCSVDSFVLQRINPRVFPHPQQVMHNLTHLSQHIRQKPADSVRLRLPEIVYSQNGKPFYQDDQKQIWRALQLISPAESRESIQNAGEAEQIGLALGHFHRLCSDLPPASLHDTLPGFHVSPGYFQVYQELIDQPLHVTIDDDFRHCQAFIEASRNSIATLEHAKQTGELQSRVVHGDPKLNNFLFEPGSNRIISLIDLDTVKPGLVHYDIGDCLRSSCHDRASNSFDLDRCRIILQNYLQEAGDFLSASDYDYLYAAIWLIPFELGLRFFSDYLAGDRYFKVDRPRHNLQRALAQFALCQDIAKQRAEIEKMIMLSGRYN